MKTSLVLDTLEMALWTRQRDGVPLAEGMIHHHDNGSQYTSFAFTSRLLDAGVDASVGSVGDAYRVAFKTATEWVRCSPTPNARAASTPSSTGGNASRCSASTRSATSRLTPTPRT